MEAIILAIMLLCKLAPAWAQTQSDSGAEVINDIKIKGFLTLGTVYQAGADTGVIRSFSQTTPSAPGWNADFDSVVGLQVDYRLNAKNNLTTQLLARPNEESLPMLRAMYWQHSWDMGVRSRMGRIVAPEYLDSDISNIGYANLMARPPLPIYGKLNALAYLDGAELGMRTGWGDWSLEAQVYVGSMKYRHRITLPGQSDLQVEVKNKAGIIFQIQQNDVRLRISHSAADRFTSKSPDLDRLDQAIVDVAGQLTAFNPGQANALRSYQDVLSSNPSYSGASLDWAIKQWFFVTEYTRLDTHSDVLGVSDAWSLTMSRSSGIFTPYVFVSRQVTKFNDLAPSAFQLNGIPLLDAYIQAIKTQVDFMRQRANLSTSSTGVGVRIEVTDSAALKLQWEKMTMDHEFAPRAGGYNGDVYVYTIKIDYIF